MPQFYASGRFSCFFLFLGWIRLRIVKLFIVKGARVGKVPKFCKINSMIEAISLEDRRNLKSGQVHAIWRTWSHLSFKTSTQGQSCPGSAYRAGPGPRFPTFCASGRVLDFQTFADRVGSGPGFSKFKTSGSGSWTTLLKGYELGSSI